MRESELLEHIYRSSAGPSDVVSIPPGDDMAMVRVGDEQLLVAIDQIVDGCHVDLQTTPIELVGRKAITRSLSDIAAMAGSPVASVAAATLPPDFGADRANALFDAMHATAAQYRCPLVGGDLALHDDASHPLVCSVTVFARPSSTGPVRRSGAQVGDTLYVTGQLGGSLDADGGGWHLTFEPRIAAAHELAEILGNRLHAMIDISDGLGRDAGHIAEQSGVGITIEADRIPCRPDFDWQAAMSDGEDYELCFAASGEVPGEIGGVVVTPVGEVRREESSRSRVEVLVDGACVRGDEMGWQHQS